VVELVEEIYTGITEAIDTLIEGVEKTVEFVNEFPEIMKQFFPRY
jgi:hypothetical protein